MIKIHGRIPREVVVATSGGVDSMAVVDFLKRNHDVTVLFVHHHTETSEDAYEFLKEYTAETGLTFVASFIDPEVPAGVSQEEHWRNERYKVFHRCEVPVITCHHLDDCAETWIWSSMHGEGKIIPYRNGNVIRPFRLNRKAEFVNWCRRKNVAWTEDASNQDNKYMRNYIRNEMMQHALVVNPGLHTVIAKKIKQESVGEN
jgi:tRNA(Ile)-lysidine synthase